ncbi:hypothetical protein PQQ96_02295 [Paraburkholderia sediminicola]|uniref:hypothetical protein n=1 Tax=Paraburkholderia sediminicola TaxID=458836 RepID=UPI0038B9E4AC
MREDSHCTNASHRSDILVVMADVDAGTHINEGDILNRLQQQRLEVLEQTMTKVTR